MHRKAKVFQEYLVTSIKSMGWGKSQLLEVAATLKSEADPIDHWYLRSEAIIQMTTIQICQPAWSCIMYLRILRTETGRGVRQLQRECTKRQKVLKLMHWQSG